MTSTIKKEPTMTQPKPTEPTPMDYLLMASKLVQSMEAFNITDSTDKEIVLRLLVTAVIPGATITGRS